MKKYIFLVLITSLLLSACGLVRQENKFDRKLKCQELKNEITAQMYQKFWDRNIAIEEVFYSPKKDSCLYSTTNPIRLDPNFDAKSLNDFFTGETLINCTTKECDDSFEGKLKELK